jgi:anhydro-N-acetylmuramic acid kinase
MLNGYRAIGIMSGTSLDGLDLAYCEFSHSNGKWQYAIHTAITHEYTHEWRKQLGEAEHKTAVELALLHTSYGHFIGKITHQFIIENNLVPDFIASHGHTIFHQPDKQLTLQIGSGAAIAAETGFPVVCDFRTTDVALGGQGAPLVPVGDKFLFEAYDGCINLAGLQIFHLINSNNV